MPSPLRKLLRLHLQGLQIDAECGEGGVVHLAVRTDQQHEGRWGRLRQHLAHALFRAGNLCHAGHRHGAPRTPWPLVLVTLALLCALAGCGGGGDAGDDDEARTATTLPVDCKTHPEACQ